MASTENIGVFNITHSLIIFLNKTLTQKKLGSVLIRFETEMFKHFSS